MNFRNQCFLPFSFSQTAEKKKKKLRELFKFFTLPDRASAPYGVLKKKKKKKTYDETFSTEQVTTAC